MAKVLEFPTDEAKRRKFINRLFEPLDNEFPTEEMRNCVRSRAIPMLNELLSVPTDGEFIKNFVLNCFAEIIRLQIEVCNLE